MAAEPSWGCDRPFLWGRAFNCWPPRNCAEDDSWERDLDSRWGNRNATNQFWNLKKRYISERICLTEIPSVVFSQLLSVFLLLNKKFPREQGKGRAETKPKESMLYFKYDITLDTMRHHSPEDWEGAQIFFKSMKFSCNSKYRYWK